MYQYNSTPGFCIQYKSFWFFSENLSEQYAKKNLCIYIQFKSCATIHKLHHLFWATILSKIASSRSKGSPSCPQYFLFSKWKMRFKWNDFYFFNIWGPFFASLFLQSLLGMRVITYCFQKRDNLRQNLPQGNSVIFATTEYFPLWNSLLMLASYMWCVVEIERKSLENEKSSIIPVQFQYILKVQFKKCKEYSHKNTLVSKRISF